MTAPAPVPASGERVASRDQMLTRVGWGGRPPSLVDVTDARGTARRLFTRLRPDRAWIFTVLFSVVGSVSVTVYGPRLLGRATDIVVTGTIGADATGVDFDELRGVMLFALGLYATGALLGYCNAWIMAGVVQRTMSRLRGEVEDKIHRLPLSYVDRTPTGDLLSRATNDIDNLTQNLQQSVSQVLQQLLMLFGVTAMMMLISPLLALFSLTLIPLSAWIVKFVGKYSRTRFAAQWGHTGDLNAVVEETFTGHSLVKVYGRRAAVEREFEQINDELCTASWKAQFLVGVMQPVTMFLGNLNYVVVGVLGSVQVTQGTLTVGQVQQFFQYSRLFTQPLTAVAGMVNMLQSGLASAERVFQLLDAPEQSADPDDATELTKVDGKVVFDHVAFAYDPERRLIEDLSLVAEPGKTVAIVGPTGAGKTTLVNLIMRFYEIGRGTITLDGVDIRTLRRRDLRGQIGMVLQDTWLFEGTIWDNIRYGDLEASDDKVLAAAKASYVDRFVHALPDGYQTLVDEDGGNLSAGEKQLLTIARAFLNNPTILILDEATSSVDTRTEMLVQQAMSNLRTERTSFVIAHRLSTIRDADVILMMRDGDIVEQGTHEELIAKRGHYFDLYDSQFRAAATDLDAEDAPAPASDLPAGVAPGGVGAGTRARPGVNGAGMGPGGMRPT